jgi:hypothetical protein
MSSPVSILEILVERLRATAEGYHDGAEEAPVAILWTDPDGAWKPVVAQLQGLMPELLMLGAYAPEQRTGPVIWLKCAIAGTIKEVEIPKGVVPILYLPGVARHQLSKLGDQCPWELQPLVELLYRGAIWTHPNGRDWSLEAFFQSAEGLGLEMAGDEKTRESLRAAIAVLAKTPVEQLRKKGRLEADDFDDIVVNDTPRDLLSWIGAPDEVRSEWGEERWHAFRSRCRDKFNFDPGKEVPLYAAEKLGRREADAWRQLWDRFCEAPGIYPGVKDALDRAQPRDVLLTDLDPASWPAENEKQEDSLRSALAKLEQKAPHVARHELNELEKEHGVRRSWVWARMDEAPLACGLAPLQQLAEATRTIPDCEKPAEWVNWYIEHGWKADAAAVAAQRSLVRTNDEPALYSAIRSVYAPWLEELARRYQGAVAKHGYAFPAGEAVGEGECLLFVDGLRYDLGQELADRIEQRNLSVSRSVRLAALPSVTPSAKPAVSPIAAKCRGMKLPADFKPNGPDGGELSAHSFNKHLEAAGYQRLKEGELLGPVSATARGWIETGRIDSRGHDLGGELAIMLAGELDRVVVLVEALIAAGWKSVKIVTDHGWLLMPGGLAKHDLPGFLVESRWSRCAAIKGNSTPDVQTVPWRWNEAEHVAVAPGAKAFKKGEAYAHGGLSLQECVTPILIIGGQTGASGVVRVAAVRWKRMRCAIELSRGEAGLKVHIERADTHKPVSPAKEVEADGQVSLLLNDEDLVGTSATVVVTDANGRVIAKADTRIGG